MKYLANIRTTDKAVSISGKSPISFDCVNNVAFWYDFLNHKWNFRHIIRHVPTSDLIHSKSRTLSLSELHAIIPAFFEVDPLQLECFLAVCKHRNLV